MLILGAVMVFLILSLMKAYVMEMEERDARLLNATLSNSNTSLFLSDELEGVWKAVQRFENLTRQDGEEGTVLEMARMEPDWSLILGQFSHVKDENFEQFLIAAGVPFYVRGLILNSSPTIVVERIPVDDYYYDPGFDHYLDEEYKDFVDEEVGVYQMLVTSSTMLSSHETRFRPGYSFRKMDRDGVESKNTYVFVAPTLLVHYKVKTTYNTNIIWSFDPDGLVVTIVNKKNGVTAKRHFKRDD